MPLRFAEDGDLAADQDRLATQRPQRSEQSVGHDRDQQAMRAARATEPGWRNLANPQQELGQGRG